MVQLFECSELVECIESIDNAVTEILLAVKILESGQELDTDNLLEVAPKLAWTRLLLANALSDLQRSES